MTAVTSARSAVGTAAAARGALDILLTDAAVGGRRRFLPAGAAARTLTGLARRPRRPATRAGALGAELARVAAGRSQLPGQDRPALRRPGVGDQPAAARPAAGVPRRRRRRRRADLGRRAGLARRAPGALCRRQRAGRARADELPVVQPRSAQGDRRPRRHEPRARRASVRTRRLALAAAARQRRHRQLHARREPGDDPRIGRAAHGRLRAHPVPPADAAGPRGPDADRGVLGRDHRRRCARSSRDRGCARRRREPDTARVRARQRACRHGRGARRSRGRGGGGRRVRPQGLPRRTRARRGVRLAAPERSDLGLRRQQLPAGQEAGGVRRPVLEPGHGPARRRPAPRLRPHRARELARAPERGRGARLPGRPRRRHHRQLRRRASQRPHRAVGERLPQRAAARRRHALRPLDERPHPGAREPPGRAGAQSRSSFRTAAEHPTRPEEWLDAAATSHGTWWPDWTAWLGERSGRRKAAPSKLGSRRHKAAGKAPGSYVHAA